MVMPTTGHAAAVATHMHHHKHNASHGEVSHEESMSAEDTRHWLFQSKRSKGLTITNIIVGVLVPVLITFVVAIILGLSLNKKYTGSFTSTTGDVKPAETLGSKQVPAIGSVTLDALSSGCACAGVAAALGLLRFGMRNFTHPRCSLQSAPGMLTGARFRVYGVYSFMMYVLLTGVLISQTYDGSLTVITDPAANQMAEQVHYIVTPCGTSNTHHLYIRSISSSETISITIMPSSPRLSTTLQVMPISGIG